ncbi:hypothetical protein GNP76_19150 [Aliivibrio fischeri]|nr:hypothetical protein [Aliivibrio fischeri]MUK71497.1 hypothetical protein [Aliivibrio fischeri]MUK75242.1 hypothetical protein [Aliivibrio fischeri]
MDTIKSLWLKLTLIWTIDNFIRLINAISSLTFLIYIYAMFVAPFIDGKGRWDYVHDVWYSWQALNVGMLAFGSSVIAFNISRYNADKQREREFIAAKAFLPESLSELTNYFKKCTPMLVEAWNRAADKSDLCNTQLLNTLPPLPNSYRAIFSSCISTADKNVGEYLAYILTRLQIHHSRLKSLESDFSDDEGMVQIPTNILSYMYRLAELQALVNKLFGYARSTEEFNDKKITLEQLETGYNVLNIEVEDIDGLWDLTVRLNK